MDHEVIVRLRAAARQAGHDALVAFSQDNVTYTAGFLVPSHASNRFRRTITIIAGDAFAAQIDVNVEENLARAHPEPRIELGRWLREHRLAKAMIDLSDGLSTDLSHICEESRVGAVLNRPLIPIARGATLEQALHGGEDYELLFTTRPKAKIPIEIAGVAVTEIGWVTREKKLLITDVKSKPRLLKPQGWEYFGNQ